jgi:biotin operon repressor
MKNGTINSFEDQQRRIKIKSIGQQMMNLAVQGAGLSPWESQVLVQLIEEVYFSELNSKELKPGQIKYQCISNKEGAGKALKLCKMVSVNLTLFDQKDQGNFSTDNNKDRSIELRRRRLVRITEEAKDQGGFLSQEDLAEILMCDVRTIRRDIKELKDIGIVIPTRGQQRDIGPGVTHRAIAIRHWLDGKEPIEVAQQIKHSIEAVENYLQKFKRVAYLKGKKFTEFEIALTVGISVTAAKTFVQLYDEFKNAPFFKQRLEEINLVGGQYWQAQDEKKRMMPSNESITKEWRQL